MVCSLGMHGLLKQVDSSTARRCSTLQAFSSLNLSTWPKPRGTVGWLAIPRKGRYPFWSVLTHRQMSFGERHLWLELLLASLLGWQIFVVLGEMAEAACPQAKFLGSMGIKLERRKRKRCPIWKVLLKYFGFGWCHVIPTVLKTPLNFLASIPVGKAFVFLGFRLLPKSLPGGGDACLPTVAS